MKKDTYVRITKLGMAPNKDQVFAGELPVSYWVEGNITEDVEIGKPVQMFRKIRNGIRTPGLFSTTPVKDIVAKHGTILFFTENSIYKLEPVVPPKPDEIDHPIVGGDKSYELHHIQADGGGWHAVEKPELIDGPNSAFPPIFPENSIISEGSPFLCKDCNKPIDSCTCNE